MKRHSLRFSGFSKVQRSRRGGTGKMPLDFFDFLDFLASSALSLSATASPMRLWICVCVYFAAPLTRRKSPDARHFMGSEVKLRIFFTMAGSLLLAAAALPLPCLTPSALPFRCRKCSENSRRTRRTRCSTKPSGSTPPPSAPAPPADAPVTSSWTPSVRGLCTFVAGAALGSGARPSKCAGTVTRRSTHTSPFWMTRFLSALTKRSRDFMMSA
mmetsp:Transcript_614/g.1512  ORF Transcript_614/g.1512 Transcript_614/m.1512 type:complete len:214 (+) Transcript_614:606-1247(+)